jgi:hypothetical protein
MKFLLEWHPAASIILLCSVSIILSYFGLRLVRKKYSSDMLRENHEAGGFIFNAFGLIYAVLIAFVVFVTWTEYDGSLKNVDSEASELADLINDSKAFPEDMRIQALQLIEEYMRNVKEDEWPLLSDGEVSEKARSGFHKLWDIYSNVDVTKMKNVPLYQESLKHLNDLSERRRTRVFDSRNDIPGVIWTVLLFGGILMVVYTFFFSMKKFAAQFLMTAALASIITIILYMIYILDHPFVGYTKITPEAFDYVLTLLK